MAHSHAPKILKPVEKHRRRRRNTRVKDIDRSPKGIIRQIKQDYDGPESVFMMRLQEWKNETPS